MVGKRGRRNRRRKKKAKDAPVNKNDKNNTNGNGSTPIRKSSQKLPKQTSISIRKEKFTSLILAHPQLDPKTTTATIGVLCKLCAISLWSMTLSL